MDYDKAYEKAIEYLREDGAYWFWLNGQMTERDFDELLENVIFSIMKKRK